MGLRIKLRAPSWETVLYILSPKKLSLELS